MARLTAHIKSQLTVQDTPQDVPALSLDSPLKWDRFNFEQILSEDSTFPIEGHSEEHIVLSPSGNFGLDLSSLDAFDGTVNFTGLQLRALQIKNLGGYPLRVSKGAVQGYAMNDSDTAAWSYPICPGGVVFIFFGAHAPLISNSARFIDFDGHGDEVIELIAVAG